jgi:chemotaxis protein MotB
MARKKPHAEHPDERWLLTYADMITLLMALFMVLYAMSMVNKVKFVELKLTLKNAFSSSVFSGGSSILSAGAAASSQNAANSELTGNDSPIPNATTPRVSPSARSASTGRTAAATAASRESASQQDAQLQAARRVLQQTIERQHLGRYARVTIENRGLVVRLVTDQVLFGLGSYELQPTALPLLQTIARTLDALPNDIDVEGYTDALPCACPLGNDGLSAYRAVAVMQYLTAHGLDRDAHHVIPEGLGSRDPTTPNAPDGSGPANRRVEIVVVRRRFGDSAGAGPIGSPISSDPGAITAGAG